MMKYKFIYGMLIFMVFFGETSGQSVSELVNQAHNRNPELKSLELQYQAALQKAPQVGQLSNPTLGLGLPILRPETRLGGQVFTLSASQMFPWMGTLKAKQALAISQARTKLEDIRKAKLEIDYQVKTSYEELYHLYRKRGILEKTIRIYESLEKVALAKVEAGKAIASDVLKIKLKIEELRYEVDLLSSAQIAFNAKINALINAPDYNVIQIDTSEHEFAQVFFDLEEIRNRIMSGHPLIKTIDQEISSQEKELELNELNNKPSFGLGLDYSWVSARSDANPSQNGRDILTPRIMVSLPIYKNKYQAKKKEVVMKKEAFILKREGISNTMISEIQAIQADYNNAKLMYELTSKQLVISASAYEILLAQYSSEGQKYDELISLLGEMNRYELASLNAIVQSHISKHKAERLTAF